VFNKVLIANRGEIACRVIRSARRLGIATVAVYSTADRDALHVEMADEALFIGDSPPRESYLRAEAVLAAARKVGADAIHPGYGFLSENAEFCQQCAQHGIAFIGPPASAIEAMGSKSAAKRIMHEAGVPLVPGYHEDDQNPQVLRDAARDMGYPVLLKAVAGGGGKGMRVVENEGEFDAALAAAQREASKSFGNDIMLVEKYLRRPRHVEIQVFCDSLGNGVYLFERDCSVQRRHQKIIEEAPAPNVDADLRARMGEAAVKAAQAIAYEGAGTVEFLLDQDGTFYFMEMNTRLQVEHPVTEMITGLDLVEWQLLVAAGEPLPLAQDALTINGHAFEARIYAEDPANDFLPVTGTLSYLQAPAESRHVRIDTGVRQGDEVSVFYDPMIAKLIVWDEDRSRALKRLCNALTDYRISGMTTNVDFLYNLASSEPFAQADLDTSFIERHHALVFHQQAEDLQRALPLAALYLVLAQSQAALAASGAGKDTFSPWNLASGWRLNQPNLHHFDLVLQEQNCSLSVEQHGIGPAKRYVIRHGDTTIQARGELQGNRLLADIEGHRLQATVVEHDGKYSLYCGDSAMQFSLLVPDLGDAGDTSDENHLLAPMNGTMVAVLVEAGAQVSKGDQLLVMEAMKMEHAIHAPAAGVVHKVFYQVGDLVDGGAQLLEFTADE
jgi:3-methylcrotonyl-CoA carboxylase alpha subunit